jgi:hypothetical protein
MSNKRASCEVLTVVLVKIRLLGNNITSFAKHILMSPRRQLLPCSVSLQSKTKQKIEAARSSKISVTVYQPTQHFVNNDQLGKEVHAP